MCLGATLKRQKTKPKKKKKKKKKKEKEIRIALVVCVDWKRAHNFSLDYFISIEVLITFYCTLNMCTFLHFNDV